LSLSQFVIKSICHQSQFVTKVILSPPKSICHLALGAFVGPLAGMRPKMPVEAGSLVEALVADATEVRFLEKEKRFFFHRDVFIFFGGGGSATPCASPPPLPSIFSNYSFWVHHLVNRDDQHLLAQVQSWRLAYL
jgi:hypothetical protein